jgi:tRNA(adenine34) deaminase
MTNTLNITNQPLFWVQLSSYYSVIVIFKAIFQYTCITCQQGETILPEPTHDYFMRLAINQAKIAAAQGDIPVGAVVVKDHKVIGRGRNQREEKQDPCAHAEVQALRDAAAQVGEWRLRGCSLYVTLEPCVMCAGAIVAAQIAHLYYGASDDKAGAVESLYQITEDNRLNHQVIIHSGYDKEVCQQLLKDFFDRLR